MSHLSYLGGSQKNTHPFPNSKKEVKKETISELVTQYTLNFLNSTQNSQENKITWR